MENSTTKLASQNAHPWSFCTKLAEKYHGNCARYQIYTFTDTAVSCALAPTNLLETTCFEALGFKLAQEHQGEVDKIQKGCMSLRDDRGASLCLISAAREIIFQSYEHWLEKSAALCDKLPGDWQKQCLASNQETIRIYHK